MQGILTIYLHYSAVEGGAPRACDRREMHVDEQKRKVAVSGFGRCPEDRISRMAGAVEARYDAASAAVLCERVGS